MNPKFTQFSGGVAFLFFVALLLSGNFLGGDLSLSNGRSLVAATPYGTATFAIPSFGGYLHQTNCYSGPSDDSPNNNSTGQPNCADGSWMQTAPGGNTTVAELSVSQAGGAPGRVGVLSYKNANLIIHNAPFICTEIDGGCIGDYHCDPPYVLIGDGTEGGTYYCQWDEPIPSSTSIAYYGNNPLSFPSGSNVRLEWSCQPSLHYVYTHCVTRFFGVCIDSEESTAFHNYFQSGSNSAGQFAVGSTAGPTQGTRTINPTSNGTVTLSCTGAKGTVQIPISYTVTAALPPLPSPSATLNAGAGNGVPATATVGVPITIVATYTAGAGDTLVATAINDDSIVASVPCVDVVPLNASNCWQIPDAQKTYTYTPTAPGVKTFSAQIKATNYVPPGCSAPGNCYDSYKTITITTVCPSGTTQQGAACVPNACGNGANNPPTCTVCTPPAQMQSGQCVVVGCSNGALNPPACDLCDPTTHMENGVCVPNGCSDPNAQPPLCSTCVGGFSMQNGACTLNPPVISSFIADPDRVRKGSATQLIWSVTNPPPVCTITGTDGFSTVLSGPELPSGSLPAVVNASTIFTLTCGSVSKSASVGILPAFQEL